MRFHWGFGVLGIEIVTEHSSEAAAHPRFLARECGFSGSRPANQLPAADPRGRLQPVADPAQAAGIGDSARPSGPCCAGFGVLEPHLDGGMSLHRHGGRAGGSILALA